MKNFKRIISTILVVIMVAMLLGACGASSKNQSANSTAGESTPANTSSEQTSSAASTVEKTSAADIKLPDVELKNKKISVYCIDDNLDGWRSKTKYPGVIELMEKEYGAQFEVVGFADWGKMEEKLAALYMSDNMPDLLMNANFPTDLGNGFVQPLDNLIDFSNPMWDGVRPILDMIKWNGKNYFGVRFPFELGDWFFFNPQLFEANNIKSPLDYYNENKWDWNTVTEIGKQMTQDLDGDGKIDQWGLGYPVAGSIIHTQTGVPLVVITPDGQVKTNFRDPKIEAAANFYRSMGPAGNNIMLKDGGNISQDFIVQQFASGKVAMMVSGWWRGGTPELINNWKKGSLDVVPLPKWPGEATNHPYGQIGSMGVSSKAKNPEGAALFIQVDRYCMTDAYRAKYMPDVDPAVDPELQRWGMTEEQMKRIYDMRQACNTEAPVPLLHWIFWSWDDGFDSALTMPWSQAVEKIEPVAQKGIDTWMEKLNKLPK